MMRELHADLNYHRIPEGAHVHLIISGCSLVGASLVIPVTSGPRLHSLNSIIRRKWSTPDWRIL